MNKDGEEVLANKLAFILNNSSMLISLETWVNLSHT